MAQFDHIASVYDEDFSFSRVGQAQRQRVHYFFYPVIKGSRYSILELNCGTGLDAEWLVSIGHHVHATDISEAMITETKKRLVGHKNAQVSRLNMNEVDAHSVREYQIVFSNFGGLNCLDPLAMKKLAKDLCELKPGSLLVLVIMGRRCIWERNYFRYKRQTEKAKRRDSIEPVPAQVGEVLVDTWYYSPAEIKDLFSIGFKLRKQRPVGLFIPPSYLNNAFKNRRFLFSWLKLGEWMFGWIGSLANYADHYYIELERK